MPIHKSQDGRETPIADLPNNHLINILNKAWNEYQANGVKTQVPNKEFLRYQFENGEHKISQVFETTYVKDNNAFFTKWYDYFDEAERRGIISSEGIMASLPYSKLVTEYLLWSEKNRPKIPTGFKAVPITSSEEKENTLNLLGENAKKEIEAKPNTILFKFVPDEQEKSSYPFELKYEEYRF